MKFAKKKKKRKEKYQRMKTIFTLHLPWKMSHILALTSPRGIKYSAFKLAAIRANMCRVCYISLIYGPFKCKTRSYLSGADEMPE